MAHDEDRPEADSSSVSPDLTTTDSTPAATSGGLTPEDIAYMQSVQKKRLVVMIIAGIVLMVLGFFAGKNMAQSRNDSGAVDFPDRSIALMLDGEQVTGHGAVGADTSTVIDIAQPYELDMKEA